MTMKEKLRLGAASGVFLVGLVMLLIRYLSGEEEESVVLQPGYGQGHVYGQGQVSGYGQVKDEKYKLVNANNDETIIQALEDSPIIRFSLETVRKFGQTRRAFLKERLYVVYGMNLIPCSTYLKDSPANVFDHPGQFKNYLDQKDPDSKFLLFADILENLNTLLCGSLAASGFLTRIRDLDKFDQKRKTDVCAAISDNPYKMIYCILLSLAELKLDNGNQVTAASVVAFIDRFPQLMYAA